MASRWITITTAAAAVFLAGTTALAQNQDTFSWNGAVERGKTLEVRGINGDVTVTAASGAGAEIRATKTGRDDDPRQVRIEVVQDDQGVLVCAVYPAPSGERANGCGRGRHGQSTRDNDVEVDFDVRIPAGVHLVAKTVNGSVDARGVSADARVASVNGDVSVVSTGIAAASSVNGSVEATMGRASWDGTLEFNSVNGSITLVLPAGTNADVEGTTLNGGFTSDFPLTVEANRTWGPKKIEGRIGSGGGKLEISSVNGSIRLRRAS